MGKFTVSKIDAAKRQIDAAIRMLFNGEDVVAVHTVACAARQIVRDIIEIQGNVESYERFRDWIATGHEKEFWYAINRSGNFFKHADRDSDATLDFDVEETDFVLLYTCKWYKDLMGDSSFPMRCFTAWITLWRPKLLTPSAVLALNEKDVFSKFQEISKIISGMKREDALHCGKLMLKSHKSEFMNQ